VAGNAVLSAPGGRELVSDAPARPDIARRLAIRSLALTDFRNHAQLRLALDGRPVVLTGDNGAGKTNLLEALSFLAPGRGLRRARLSEVTRSGSEHGAWAVAAALAAEGAQIRLGTGLAPGGNGAAAERRVVRIDGAPQSGTAALAQVLSVVWLTPEMDRLFDDAAANRRRFFDRLAFGLDAGHASRLNAYERALRERSRLLRDGCTDAAWLDATEAAMAGNGVAVAAVRRETLARLGAALDTAGQGPFPRPGLALEGLLESWLDDSAALDAEDRFARLLWQNRGRDAQAGRALDGPHRSDLAVRHGDTGMPAAACSTGQQKALLIAIVLANARMLKSVAAAPILLLDEVAAHLDTGKRAALFDAIEALGAQAWLTGADRFVFAAMGERAQHFSLADGQISEIPANLKNMGHV